MRFLDGIDNSSQKIIHVADGSANDDAATWGQVQAFVNGLNWKQSVEAASTANVTLSSAPASLDGVTLSASDRVLLKNQTNTAENGVYVYTATGSALTRSSDLSSSAQFNNATVFVQEGTTNSDTAWTQTAVDPTVGTTAIAWVQFGAATVYTAGNGLALSGNAFSVKLPGSGVIGLVVDSTGIYIDTSVVVRKFAQTIGDGSSTSIVVTHNLGTKDVHVQLRDASTDAFVMTDWTATSTNSVTLTFAVAPASNAYRVVVHG